jgi:hypothetical protein
MIYTEILFLEANLVDDGTLDTVVQITNTKTERSTLYRYDSDSVQYPEVLEEAKEQYVEDLFTFLSYHSDF